MNWVLLKNSFVVAVMTTLLSAVFGLLTSFWISGLERRWRSCFLGLAIMALAMPPFLVTNTWLHFLGQTGVWRGWLPLNIVSLGGTIWILALLTWPITSLAVSSAWRRLQPAQVESDPALTGLPLFRVLLWPLGRAALAQAALLTFVLALNNFAVPAILQVKVFPAEIWVRFTTTFDTLNALKISWPLIVAPLVLLAWFMRRGMPWPHVENPVPPRLFRQQLGRGWFFLSGASTSVLCLLSIGLPVWQLISTKRTWTELGGAVAAGQGALWNSCWFAALSASIIVALVLAFAGPIQPGRDQGGMRALRMGAWLWLPFLLPGVIMGIALIKLFNHSWSAFLYQSAAIVILAFVIRYLALGWTALDQALGTVDRDLADAARLSGANRWQMLRHVFWPQIAPQAAAAWYIIFLLCLWDAESIILILPPGGETLALRVFNLLHYGHNAQVNALCLTLLALAVAPLVLWKALNWLQVASTRTTLLLMVCVGLLFAGCQPGSAPNSAAFASQLFDQVQIIGTRGAGIGEVNKPRSVAVDKQDNCYVVDMTGRVQKFSPDGKFLLFWQMPQTDKGKPKGMCRDREGNIVVIEPHYQRVNTFSPEGRLIDQWGHRGTNAGQLIMPRAAAVNSQGETFVSEYSEVERVQRFSAHGEQLLACFGQMGNAPGEFNRPEGLCLDSHDQLHVADSCNHRIQIFSSDGKFLRAFGKPGTGKGELSYPYDICVDSAGRQYVCEFGNSRIQVFDANDRPIEIIGGPGAEPGKFSNPWGVALDSAGNLYVADSQNHRVQKLVRRKSTAGISNQRSAIASLAHPALTSN